MNKQQAQQAGYNHSGHFSWNKEEQKENAKKERAKGNKAVVVTVPADKYARGNHGAGYAVYIIKSAENERIEEETARRNKLGRLESEKSNLLQQLAVIEAEILKMGEK